MTRSFYRLYNNDSHGGHATHKGEKMKKFLLVAIAALTMVTGAQAKSPVINKMVCEVPSGTNTITLYRNKTVSIKWSDHGKSGAYKAKWTKTKSGIRIVEPTEMPGAGGWMTYGTLKATKRGHVLYNPEQYGRKSPKCKQVKKTKRFPAKKYVCNAFRDGPAEVYRLKRNGTYTINGKQGGKWKDHGTEALLYQPGTLIGPNSWDVRLIKTDKGIRRNFEGVPRYRGRCYMK